MLFYFTGRIISAAGAFLYPGYASYKVLNQRPAPEHELERWLMYWSILGCFIGVEYIAEWLVSWIPFYYTFKTFFLLYLALPQTQGASYLYVNHLYPFLHEHEAQIDATLASLKARAYAFIQERARALWEAISHSLLAGNAQFAAAPGTGPTGAPPPMADSASGPAQLLSGLWRSYGPAVAATGAALLNQVTAGAQQQQQRHGHLRGLTTPAGSTNRGAQSVQERRRQLEAELAALGRDESDVYPRVASRVSSHNGADSTRIGSPSGRFEELAQSDVEGYEIDDEDGGGNLKPSGAGGKGSWFGWGGAPSKGASGYERVKEE